MNTPFFAALLALALSGCAAAPVTQRTPRDYDGFSIVPPKEPGWFVKASGDRKVIFQKRSVSDAHEMLVGVERSRTRKGFDSKEEFLQHVKDSYFNVDPQFYEFLVKEASLNPKHGEYCVEYRYKYKDFKSPRPKSASFLLHEGHCFVCRHPNAKDREYDVCYSEMFAPGEEDSRFRVAGDAFIESVRFTEPSEPGAIDPTSVSLIDNKNRAYFLQLYPYNPFFNVRIALDGKKVAKLSSGEVATVKVKPGEHAIKVSFSLSWQKKSFYLIQDNSNYFVIREPKISDKPGANIMEVPEADWKYLAINAKIFTTTTLTQDLAKKFSLQDKGFNLQLLISPIIIK